MSNTDKDQALASIAGLSGQGQSLPKDFIGTTGHGTCAVQAPSELSHTNSLDEILVAARQAKASDIHISSQKPIVFRQYGQLKNQTDLPLTADQAEKLGRQALTEHQLKAFIQHGDLECVYTIAGAGRFRVTLMRQRFGWDLTARVIPLDLPTFEESGMPASCQALTKWAQGLVLVTGPAGCGKTTSLNILVEMINGTRNDHIITIEDPIEYIFSEKSCQITQREIGLHTLSQSNALRAALREDPDILVVSELRDLNSIQLAVSAAETGHLVFGTMNTNDAAQTLSKLIDSFPPDEQSVIRNMVSESLRGVISQQLIPRKDGDGQVPAFEVLIVNTAIANMIRSNQIGQVTNAMATNKSAGMVLLDHSLRDLVQKGLIRGEEAFARAISRANFSEFAPIDGVALG